MFDKLVSPILNYAGEVWGFHKASTVETVHLQFCKKVLGVKRSTQNDFIYGELGRTDYQSRRYIAIIKFWLKIISCNENKYLKHVYNMMLNDMETHPLKQNWAISVKQLLSRLGFMEVWDSQGVGNEMLFLAHFKTRVNDIFMQEWHSRLEASTRARFYITIAKFGYQNYLDVINIEKLRISLSKLRVSSHRLEVESGRWMKPHATPFENRKCKICCVLEDEYHFVLECLLYVDIRKIYLQRYFWNRPNMIKFIELLTTDN